MAHPANIRQRAIQLLRGGERVNHTARELNVPRQTVSNWKVEELDKPQKEKEMTTIEQYQNIPLEQCMIAYPSTDYDDFSLIKINRPVDERRVAKIVKKIEEGKNYLRYYPIIVNQAFEIIDGQHRHSAARQTRQKLYFFFGEDLDMEDAAIAVSNTKGWTVSDYLHSYAEREYVDYMILRQFYNKHSHIPISTLVGMCTSTNFRGQEFSNGHYKANRIEPARRAIEMAESFKPYGGFTTTKTFLYTLMNLSTNPDYDHKQMISKMKYRSSIFRQCVTVEEYLDMFSDIYNYRSAPRNRVFFKEQYRRKQYA